VYCGFVAKRKGILQLIEAFQKLNDPQVHLWVIGRRSIEIPRHSNIHYIPPVPHNEAIRYVRSADIVVVPTLPSPTRDSPMKLFEAMATGKPVIASDIEGNRLITTHQKNGMLYPPYDTDMLALYMRKLIEDKKLIRRISKEARETVRRRYTWIKRCQKVLESLSKV
jgi:glycosyltransferase involved in cell wall biosynthesis